MFRLSDRRFATVLGVVLFFSYAYFYQAGGWNQNARFGLVRAILERRTLAIDAYQQYTGDKALWQGHYYSDKAPGASLLALGPVAIARGVLRLARINRQGHVAVAWMSYVATVATSGLFTVIAALLVMRLTLRWGYSRSAALFASTAYAIGGPAFCYATLFMGHGIAAGSLMLAFAGVVNVGESVAQRSPSGGARQLFLVGFWVGLAVLTEFPSAIPSCLIGLWALLAFRRRGARRILMAAALIAAGGAIPAIALLAHNTLAFGSPLHLGYAVADSPLGELHTGFFGITSPAGWRIREILVGAYRGLLPLSPLIAVTPVGLAMLARRSDCRAPALVAASTATFYLLFNASYYYWEGGWAYGPRQMMSALPFLALGLAPLWDVGRRWGRLVLISGWCWGVALTLIAVSTTPQPPSTVQAPVRELLWPAFKDGDLSLNNQSFLTYRAQPDLLRGHPELHAGMNLGEALGLRGLWSLLALGLVWVTAGFVLLPTWSKAGRLR
jgi:hypothetical protein